MEPFRERKYLDCFGCLDADSNGLLERADFEHSAQHIAEALGWGRDALALVRLRAAQAGLLDQITTAQPEQIGISGPLSAL